MNRRRKATARVHSRTLTREQRFGWMLALALGLLSFALLSRTARSETIAEGDQVSVVNSDLARPGRGMTMKAVESKFGAPQDRHAAVGKPPITRWDYQGFTVFFENDRVIHAVVNPPPQSQGG